MGEVLVVAVLGLILGIAFRTILPYIRKARKALEQGEDFKFDKRFALSALLAFVVSLGATAFALPQIVNLVERAITTNMALTFVFGSAFAHGYTANDIVNQIIA